VQQDTPTPGHDLTDMQCTWFLQEEGDAFNRAGKLGKALKRYKQVITVRPSKI
jgi:peptide alpha-N-acetyltransferase